ETIGFAEDDKHAITRSLGVGLPEEQMTLKISWESGGYDPDGGTLDGDDEDTLEPSELAEALMEYLDCECTYIPSMKDDDPIMSAYSYARRDAAHDGFVPVLIRA